MISKFNLGAVEWIVKTDNDRLDDLGLLGLCEHSKATITLFNDDKVSKDIVDQTLYHEVVHAILNILGEDKLNTNEEFVQKVSLLLHQFEKTKK